MTSFNPTDALRALPGRACSRCSSAGAALCAVGPRAFDPPSSAASIELRVEDAVSVLCERARGAARRGAERRGLLLEVPVDEHARHCRGRVPAGSTYAGTRAGEGRGDEGDEGTKEQRRGRGKGTGATKWTRKGKANEEGKGTGARKRTRKGMGQGRRSFALACRLSYLHASARLLQHGRRSRTG